MKVWTIATVILLMATTTFSAGPGDVLGPWKTDGGDAWLELFECGEKICGTIGWLKEPNYIDGKNGPVGKTKVDRENRDPALRNRPILGLQILNGFTAKGNNRWANGTCYDPESGKSYKCKMHLVSTHKLELRGYIGISLFGRTVVLTR